MHQRVQDFHSVQRARVFLLVLYLLTGQVRPVYRLVLDFPVVLKGQRVL